MAEDNIVYLEHETRLDIPVSRVLDGAEENLENGDFIAPIPRDKLAAVVVLGWDKDGEFYIASNIADGPECLWLLQKGINQLMKNS